MWRFALAALAVGLGLARQVEIAAAEGEPPRVVLVQTAGIGAERQTTVMSSSNPAVRVIGSDGPATGGQRPEAVLGERAARPAPLAGSAGGARPGGPLPGEPAPPPRAAEPSGLAPAELRCVRDALGRAAQSGLIPRDQPSIGPIQIGWVAGQCDLDPSALAATLARALGEPGLAPPAAARPASPPPTAEPAQRPSWQRSILDEPGASTPERAHSERQVSPTAPTAERLLPLWQLALLGLTGLTGLAGALYGLSWLARPHYVVRVIPQPPTAFPQTRGRGGGRRGGPRPAPTANPAWPSRT